MKKHTAMMTVLTLSAWLGTAHAGAWDEAKKVLPDMMGVGDLNVSVLQSSTIYQTFFPMVMAQAGDAKTGLDLVKSQCSIDVTTSITDLVVAMDAQEKGLIVLGLKGVDADTVSKCLAKLSSAKGGEKVTVAKSGSITAYTAGEQTVYAAWLSKNVVAIATDPKDKELLTSFIGGGGKILKGDLGKLLAKVSTKSAFWMAASKSVPLGGGMGTMTGGYGTVDITKGNVVADAHIVMADAASAKDAATKGNQGLADAKKGGQIPANLMTVVNSVSIKSSGNELQVSGSASEKDILQLISTFMSK
jgi:hypothetical protein